jgi:hypothetical protein
MRTSELLIRAFTFFLFGSGVATLVGCPAQPQRMAAERATVPMSARFLGQITIANVTGGKAVTMTSSISEVSNEALRDALNRSLKQVGYLSADPDAASLLLKVGVVDVENPHQASLTIKVVTLIRYQLASKARGAPLFDELITASCTRTLSDDMVGMKRMQHADECAVKNNIAEFLNKLNSSGLN